MFHTMFSIRFPIYWILTDNIMLRALVIAEKNQATELPHERKFQSGCQLLSAGIVRSVF